MKLQWNDFAEWVSEQSQSTENEFLEPKDKSVGDEETVDVINLRDALGIMYRLVNGKIEVDKEEGECT